MTPLEPVVLSFTAAFLLGLSFGAGPCSIACLPYLGPVFLARDVSGQGPWHTVLPFSAGRLAGYALLGAGAGWAGLLVQGWIAGPWVKWLLGSATVTVGLTLLWRSRNRPRCTPPGKMVAREVRIQPRQATPVAAGGLFAMGLGMALNPCAPLTTVILASATTASALGGLSLGGGFGLGAVIFPALIFGYGVSRFGEEVRRHVSEWERPLEAVGAALLIVLGIATFAGWVTP